MKLNNKFYSREIVEMALKDFKEACDGKILDDSIKVELYPKGEAANLEEEFCNYVLGLMKNRILV